ncbi:MAG: hypothetical protein ABSC19_15820 [Syntrophorhabdales bacterium]|jgi:hypothetical protein
MSDEKLRVEVTADSDGLKSGMAEAKTAVQQALEAMQSNFASAAATISSGVSGMQEAIGGLPEGFDNMASSLGGLTGLLNPFTSAAKAVTEGFAAMAGVFRVAASEEEKYIATTLNMARALGITAEEAQTFKQAMDEISAKYATSEVSTESVVSAFKRFAMQIGQNKEMFEKLGIELKNQDGTWKNSFDMFMEAVQHLQKLETQQQKVAFAAKALGRGVSEDMIVVLEHLSQDSLEEAHAKLEKLGLIIGPEMVAKLSASKQATVNLHDQWASLSASIATVAIPAWTMMKNALALIPEAINGVIHKIHEAMSAYVNLMNRVREYITGEKAAPPPPPPPPKLPPGAMPTHENAGAAPEDLSRGSSGGAEKSQMAAFEEQLKQKQLAEKAWDGLSLAQEEAFWQEKLNLVDKNSHDYIEIERKILDAEIRAGKEGEQVQESKLRNALKINEEIYKSAEELASREFSTGKITADQKETILLAANAKRIEPEKTLYDQLAALAAGSVKQAQKVAEERAAAERKAAEEVKKINQTAATEKQKLNVEDLKDAIKTAQEKAKAEESAIAEQYRLKQINAQQEHDLLVASAAKAYDTEKSSLDQEIAGYAQGTEQYKNALRERERLDIKYTQQVKKYDDELKLEQQKNWQQVTNELSGPFQSALQTAGSGILDMGKNGQTWQQTMIKAVQQVIQGFEKLIEQIVMAIAKQELFNAISTLTEKNMGSAGATGIPGMVVSALHMTPGDESDGLSQAAKTLSQAGDTLQQAGGSLLDSASNLLGIGGEGGGGIFGDIGDMAGILAFDGGGDVPSARLGWDVPSNGIRAILHPNEMVLPEDLANRVRNMTAGSGPGGGSRSGHTYNIHTSGINPKDMAAAVKAALRMGRR